MTTINSVGTSLFTQTGTGAFVGSTSPTITTPLMHQINDTNGAEILLLTAVASAVNYLTISNNTTGNEPTIASAGSDSNVSIILAPKGDAGVNIYTAAVTATPLQIYSGTSKQHITNFSFANTAVTRNVAWPDASGTVLLTTSVKAPTIQQYLSGTGTYTTPTSPAPLYIRVVMVGGGGGGYASGTTPGTPGTGGNSTFGTTLLSCGGGNGGAQYQGGVGGAASLGSGPIGLAVSGAMGGGSDQVPATTGGNGASSFFGGQGPGAAGAGNPGYAAATNSGSGGGGAAGLAGAAAGSGGGAGAYLDAIITSPAATYAYAVGALGAGGTLGTGGAAGGNGAAGQITVYEYYQ